MGRKTYSAGARSSRSVAVGQVGIVAAAVGYLLLGAPAFGQIALYPLSHDAARDLPVVMLEDGRRLVARTAIADGFVVEGARPDVLDLLLRHGILALGVPASGCAGTTDAE